MKKDMYNHMDWSEHYKSPMVENYQPKENEFAGIQHGKTLNYIERRDREQGKQAKKVDSQMYHGRYD